MIRTERLASYPTISDRAERKLMNGRAASGAAD